MSGGKSGCLRKGSDRNQSRTARGRNSAKPWLFLLRTATPWESVMGLTGKFKFRKTLWGKIVLQVEEEVKPFWSRSQPDTLKRRWRDATLVDLAAPEMRT